MTETQLAAERTLEEEVRRQVWTGKSNDLFDYLAAIASPALTAANPAISWGRRSSIWPLQFGLACCAIEMICTAACRFDISRFGSELFRASPRQADLMIVSGTVTKKMVPMIVRLYNQMAEPKYVLSMGACANGGGPFKEGYNVVSGIDEFLPVDVYARGCPPTPQALLHAFIELQKKIDDESYVGAWKRRRRAEIPVPLLGPDLVDLRQLPEIKAGLAKGDAQRLKAPAVAPTYKAALKVIEVSGLDDVSPAKVVGARLAERFGANKVQAHAKHALVVDPSAWRDVARSLKADEGYDALGNLSSADFQDAFEVAYHLYGVATPKPQLTVKVRTPKANPEVPSAASVWAGADLQEREVWDLMGIKFTGHPNLKRILMWEGFAGHPLRKDWLEAYYEEPRKMFSSRWKEGHHHNAETRNAWGRNVVYPADMKIEELESAEISDGPAANADPSGGRHLLVSMGPQHPSTHGVFQMRVMLDGERVAKLDPVFGYLHRNHEKIGERNTWIMNMPYTDRLDYITSMANNLAYAVAVERLAGIKVPERAEYIRVIMAELTRIVNHFWSAAFLMQDLGAFATPMMYAIEERELILDLFEMASGSRMMCNYMRFGGVSADLPEEFLPAARALVHDRLPRAIHQIDDYLTKSEIVRSRCQGIGILTKEQAVNFSTSGPVLRASGVAHDIRKADPYGIYDRFQFDVVTMTGGDVYDRYRVRIAEMWQSLRILEQALKDIPEGPFQEKQNYLMRAPEGDVYSRTESPKGELGFYLVSDGNVTPYRYHVRSPSFVNLTALETMCKGHLVADIVAILGSIDIVLGEVDR